MREHVADRAALLAATPAVDEIADAVVESEPSLLPELEHGDGRHRLARGVPEHDVVDRQLLARPGLAHGHVEHGLALDRHVALGAELPAVRPLSLEQLGHLGEVKSGSHDAEA